MPRSSYEQIDAVNGSTLFHARRSWLHYKDALDNPRPQSSAMALGIAGHVSILEPDEFPRRYVVLTRDEVAALAPPRNGKRGKARWAAYLEVHPEQDPEVDAKEYRRLVCAEAMPDKSILEADDYAKCIAMRDAVRRHPIAGPLLAVGAAEQVIRWTEHVPHGLGTVAVAMKGRLDLRIAPQVFLDLKTTRATTPHQFAGQSWGLSTFHKIALYRRGIAANEGCSRGAVVPWVIAVENTRPFDVTVCEVMPGGELPTGYRHGLDDCDAQIDELLRGLVQCRETGKWPGANEGKAVDLYPPSYAFGGAGDVEFLDTDPADAEPLEMEA
jgi:PDDEXK-like domain of unknown function (DUF3799)